MLLPPASPEHAQVVTPGSLLKVPVLQNQTAQVQKVVPSHSKCMSAGKLQNFVIFQLPYL